MNLLKVVILVIISLFVTNACSDTKSNDIKDVSSDNNLPIQDNNTPVDTGSSSGSSSSNVDNTPSDTGSSSSSNVDNTPVDTGSSSSSSSSNIDDTPSVDTGSQVTYDSLNVSILGNNAQYIDSYNGGSYKTILYNAPSNPVDDINTSVSYTISTTGSSSNKLYNSYKLSDEKDKPVVNNLSYFRDLEKYFLDNKIPQATPIRAKGTIGYNVGDVVNNIFISRDGSLNFTTVSMRCVAVTDEAYIFIEGNLQDFSSSVLKQITDGITEIFPVMHNIYGKSNDVDGNGKVIILFTNFSTNNLLGYFFSGDKYQKHQYQYSNVKDMFYVNYNAVARDIYDILSTIAHEYQHMIHFDVRSNNNLKSLDLWINEGLSMQAMYHTGYLFKQKSDYIEYFMLYHDGVTLIEDGTGQFDIGNYGYSLVYFRYLLERFGDDLIKKLYQSSHTGIKAIEEVTGENFNDIFRDFVKAVFLNGKGYKLPKEHTLSTINLLENYNYLRPHKTLYVGQGLTSNLVPYGLHLVDWKGKVNTINLSGNDIGGYGYSFDK